VAALAAGALAAAGCTYVGRTPPPPSDTPYQRDVRQASLEVPPDLTRSGIRDAYPVPGADDPSDRAETVLPRVEGVRIERDGHLRWLVAEAEPADLWPSLRDFWRRQGFALDTDDPQVGILETGWAEKRVDLPVSGVRRWLERFKRFAYTYGVRDRFRTRVERSAEPGLTEIYVTHQGAHEEVRGDSYAWAPRPSDPAVETEMLGRLMHFLASGDASAVDPAAVAAASSASEPRAGVMDDAGGGKYIRLNEGFDRGWRLVRRALDRGGFTVVDLDRTAGFFLVRYIDPEASAEEKRSWLGRLAFWRDRSKKELPEDIDFRIALERGDGGPPTRVVVQDAKGARDTGESAGRILAALAENIE
jgi:outer membrane protein assembly factor BamC